MGGRGGSSGVGSSGGGGGGAGGAGNDRFNRLGEPLPPKLKTALTERFENGTQLGKDIYDHYIPPGGVVYDPHSADAYYSPAHNMVWMNLKSDAKNTRGAGSTWLHEHGHFVDFNIGWATGRRISDDRAFQQALKRDVASFEREYERLHNTSHFSGYNAAYAVALELRKSDKTSAIQDIFGGVHRDRSYYYWGHDNTYWTSDQDVAIEAAAHMFEAQFGADKASYMEKYLPTAWRRYNELLEQDRKRWKKTGG